MSNSIHITDRVHLDEVDLEATHAFSHGNFFHVELSRWIGEWDTRTEYPILHVSKNLTLSEHNLRQLHRALDLLVTALDTGETEVSYHKDYLTNELVRH